VDDAMNLNSVKEKQRAAWQSGNYAVIGTTLQIVGEQLAEACDLRTDERVIDVAAGNGNATLAAARRGCQVVSTDYVEELLQRGSARAEAEGLNVEFKAADAEDLPFASESFDAVLSTFGAMFAPNHEKTAAELVRVCKHGGRIGLANWTPESMVGELFRILGRYIPPPPGVKAPSRWGDEVEVKKMFEPHAKKISIVKRNFNFRYRSAEHFIDIFRSWYGPVHKAFLAIPVEKSELLANDIRNMLNRLNVGGSSLVVPSEYAEIVVTRK
jgi:ubiquinone/menaquinone biosynthesis C-methylase UbiE